MKRYTVKYRFMDQWGVIHSKEGPIYAESLESAQRIALTTAMEIILAIKVLCDNEWEFLSGIVEEV